MVDKEMLAAIEELLDRKLEEKLEEKLEKKFEEKLRPINECLARLDSRMAELKSTTEELKSTTEELNGDITYVKEVLLENDIIPRLNTIEKCYVETSRRYMEHSC